jgi:hypothetical protein
VVGDMRWAVVHGTTALTLPPAPDVYGTELSIALRCL